MMEEERVSKTWEECKNMRWGNFAQDTQEEEARELEAMREI